MLGHNRNQVVHSEEGKSLMDIIEDTKLWIGEYKRLYGFAKQVSRGLSTITQWCDLQNDGRKLNKN